ncbi:hypothetical protein [Hydrogenophaga pseudoflava]|uniref:hypothetical protein n=1 Tax=Hydrogenophaga pseudoflava TaxID=47421 RepID=UPI0027E465E9|nr:hypothetical protein [Hydrogenophaga pseudoflava]MDQ7746662.1 hypothetical protein [Hydrogenophaga pseudoflava]
MNQTHIPPTDPSAGHGPAGGGALVEGATPSLKEFEAAYDRWKAATVTFEQAVRRMRGGDPAAREQAQECARELAQLHHAFLEASQPHFAASARDTRATGPSEGPWPFPTHDAPGEPP